MDVTDPCSSGTASQAASSRVEICPELNGVRAFRLLAGANPVTSRRIKKMVSEQKSRIETLLMALLIFAIPIRGQGATEIRDQVIGSQSSSADACVPRPLGLLAWYPGDNSAVDLVGGRNGTAEGGAGFAPARVDQGFLLPPGSRIVVPDDPVWTLGDKPFTYEAWVNFESLEQRTPIIGHDEGAGERNKWILWYDAVGHRSPFGPALRFHVNSPVVPPLDPIVYPWEPEPHRWYHVAITRDGNTYALYIDGVRVITEVDSHTIPDPEAPLTIGEAEGFSFHGLIDEVGFYGRALSAKEIEDIFLAGSAGKCKTGPQALVPLCRSAEVFTRPGTCSSEASIDGGSFDAGGGEITLSAEPPPPYDLGDTPVVLRIEGAGQGDGDPSSSSCEATVSVVDPEPPSVECNAEPLLVFSGESELRFAASSGDNCETPQGVSIRIVEASCMKADYDGDGIPDDEDECPGGDASDLLRIDDCETGLENFLLDSGCTFADLILECAEGADNHGAYVSCVALLTNEWKARGWISGSEQGIIQACAAKAPIPLSASGKRGLVTPRRYDLGALVDDGERSRCDVIVEGHEIVVSDPPRSGLIRWEVVAEDGSGNSTTRSCMVTVQDPELPVGNQRPVADAGSGQHVLTLESVTLDGGKSRDLEGRPLSYIWKVTGVPVNSTATLSDPTGIHPSFTADRPGTYEAQLVVNDGELDSLPAVVRVTAQNARPIARAGMDQEVFPGTTVQLVGSDSSDPEGDAVGYLWNVALRPERSTATLSDPQAVSPSFVADAHGDFVIQLVVSDGELSSLVDAVRVTVLNRPPLADAGSDQSAFRGEPVELDGRSSVDPDGDVLTFLWRLVSRPAGSSAVLSNGTEAVVVLVADLPGDYVAELVVSDGIDTSEADTVTLTAINRPPTADAGPDQTAFSRETVRLDGSLSADADGDSLTYWWEFVSVPSGSNAVLSGATAVTPTFVPDLTGSYVVRLLVSDSFDLSTPDETTVTVLNSPPVANAGADQSVFVGATVMLEGEESFDIDGDPITFHWSVLSFPAGSAVVLSNPDSVNPTFVADEVGTYELQLIVNDGQVDSQPDVVSIEVTIPLVTVPDVVKLGRDEAEALLLSAELAIGSVKLENSANVPRGAVIRQTPSSGAEVPAGTSVDLVISSGPSILIRVPKMILSAGEALDYSVEVYDPTGELVVPTPLFEVGLEVEPDELSGTLPALSGGSVLTAPDTRGAFSLRVTVPSTSQSATLELVVTSDHAEMVPYSDLSGALISVDEYLGILSQAATDDDFALIDSLLAELTATRDAMDLEALRRSVPIALDVGFPPTLDQVIAAGYSETADDAVLFSLAGEIIDQMMTTEALVGQLDPDSVDDLEQLRLLNGELESLANQINALNPTVYGIIKSSSRLSHLVSVRTPTLLRTLIDRVAAIGEMAVGGSLTSLHFPQVKLDFVDTLAGVAISAQLQVRIIQKLYVPFMKEIGKSVLIMAAADLISKVVNVSTLDAVITGGSQSFQVFDAPFSAIEGVGFDVDFVDGNDVYLIGPDAIDACLEILNEVREALDILGDITDADEIPELPIAIKNTFDLKAKFDEIKELAVAAWNQANAEPDVVVQGCLFNPDPACHQLIFTDGFRSVHSSGFLPAPVLVIVRNVSDSGFGTLVVNFLPKTDSAE